MRVPALCTIDQRPGNGGIARVSLLLWQVIRNISNNQCRLIQLLSSSGPVRPMDKMRFISKVVSGQVSNELSWLMFDHVGPAATQCIVPKPFRRPYGVFIHSFEAWGDLKGGTFSTLKNATLRVANSYHTAQKTLDRHKDIGHIHVCHLALAPEDQGDRDSWTSGPVGDRSVDRILVSRIRDDSVLIVGRMASTEDHKGHDQLIQAWPSVRAQVPDAQLIIVGRGDDAARLMHKSNQINDPNSVLFTDWVSEATLQEIYRRVAVFALPSAGEGFGLVFLEAMKHALPCIGSIHDAGREIVVDGATGFLIDRSDKEQLGNRVLTLLREPGLRQAMGEAGFNRLYSHFSFERFSARMASVLEPLRQLGNAPN